MYGKHGSMTFNVKFYAPIISFFSCIALVANNGNEKLVITLYGLMITV